MDSLKNKVSSILTEYAIVDAHMSVKLNVDGKEYHISQFKTGFSQRIDHKGQPQSEISGGQFIVSMTQTLPESFYSWNIDDNRYKNGTIIFKLENSRTVLEIEFFNARCINITRNLSIGQGVVSTIVISPSIVKFNGMEHDNRWKHE